VQLGEPGADDIVAAVGTGVIDRFVLAHECEGDGGGEAAEGAGVGAGVDVVPCAGVGEAGLVRRVMLERVVWRGWWVVVCMYLSNELRHGGGGRSPSRAQRLLGKRNCGCVVFVVKIAVEQ
jgi:hypothetical protein